LNISFIFEEDDDIAARKNCNDTIKLLPSSIFTTINNLRETSIKLQRLEDGKIPVGLNIDCFL